MLRRASLAFALFLVACGDGAAPSDGPTTTGPDDEIIGRGDDGAPPAPAPSSTGKPASEPELRPTALANLGDSISQGYDADDAEPLDLNALQAKSSNVFKDEPQFSWVHGTDARVGSVASFFKTKNPSLVVTPFSRSGAEMVTTGGQPNFEDQAKALAKSGATPDLVYVLLGANDVCHKAKSKSADATETLYPVEQWKGAVSRGLAVLASALPAGAVVRVVSMPRVDLLYDVAKDRKVTVKGRIDTPAGPVTGNLTKTCNELWQITATAGNGVCAIVTTEGDPSRRAAIGARIDAYNDALAAEVTRMRDDVAANPKKVAFQTDWHGSIASGAAKNGAVGTTRFEANEVSARDCFHPSVAGQHAIAKHVLERAAWTPPRAR